MRNFYRAALDEELPQRFLDAPSASAPTDWRAAQRLENIGHIQAGLGATDFGPLRDLAWAHPFVAVVSESVVAVIDAVTPGAVQWLPIIVQDHPEPPRRFLLNALHLVDCIDEEKSIWSGEAGRVEGEPPAILLRVRNDLDPPVDIFRVQDHEAALIVTERLKVALEDHGFQGWRWDPVAAHVPPPWVTMSPPNPT